MAIINPDPRRDGDIQEIRALHDALGAGDWAMLTDMLASAVTALA